MDLTLRQHIDQHPDIQSGKAVALVWSADDVLELQVTPEEGYPISQREAKEILKKFEDNHTLAGVAWEVLEDLVRAHLRENPRTTHRADVAVGFAPAEGREGGGWTTRQVEVPSYQLEGLTEQEIAAAFEKAAQAELDASGEAHVFVRAISWVEAAAERAA